MTQGIVTNALIFDNLLISNFSKKCFKRALKYSLLLTSPSEIGVNITTFSAVLP